jgi:hypothetical protein
MSVDIPGPSEHVQRELQATSEGILGNASVDNFFLEGASIISDIKAVSPSDHADDELAESEPGLDELTEQGKALHAQLVRMLDEYDSWSSLVEHHKRSKKYKK